MSPTAITGSESAAVPADIHVSSTAEAKELEDKHAAHNYHPLPVVFAKAKGIHVWDPEVSLISRGSWIP